MIWLDYLPHFIALVALIVAVAAYVGVRRGIGSMARADALLSVGKQVAELEAEVLKLQLSLNRALGERIGLKEEIMALKKELRESGIEIEGLKSGKN